MACVSENATLFITIYEYYANFFVIEIKKTE